MLPSKSTKARERGAHGDLLLPELQGDCAVQAGEQEEHCAQIETDKAVCYCKFCTDGINMGGKTGVHLLELLF